ncbi:MAG: HAD family hydrolase, partial [Paracoccaceae bacterium]|nr:HAD family hydrolase [Paracoccaceae bacterium]
MIDGVIFDKDGTLFDFRKSWSGWAVQLLASLATDDRHAALMASALGYDRSLQDFYPDSPVIAGTAQEIALGLLPHLPGMTQEGLAAQLNAIAQR